MSWAKPGDRGTAEVSGATMSMSHQGPLVVTVLGLCLAHQPRSALPALLRQSLMSQVSGEDRNQGQQLSGSP